MTNLNQVHQLHQTKTETKVKNKVDQSKLSPVSGFQMFEAPETLCPEDILAAQRQVGNQVIQRALDKEKRQKRVTGVNGELVPELNDSIQKKRGSGAALPESVRKEAQKTLGRDFKDVRIHTDEESHQLSRSINARAFTIGKDIFFKRGVFAPGTSAGRETLLHELTHVVQQSGSKSNGPLKLGAPDTAHEKEADQIGKKHVATDSVGAAHGGAVQAQAEEELQAQPDTIGIIQRVKSKGDDDWETDPEPVGNKQPKSDPVTKEKFKELTGQLSGQLSKGTHKGAMQKVFPRIKSKTESMKLGSPEHMSRLNALEKKPDVEKQKKRAFMAGLASDEGKKNREARDAENERVKAKQEEKEAGTFKGGIKKAWKDEVSEPFKKFKKGLPGKISGGIVKGGVGLAKGLGKGLLSGFTEGFKHYAGSSKSEDKGDEKDEKKEEKKGEEKDEKDSGAEKMKEKYAEVLKENKKLKAELDNLKKEKDED